jgi:quercetin dioxygenase-like cupin family protein
VSRKCVSGTLPAMASPTKRTRPAAGIKVERTATAAQNVGPQIGRVVRQRAGTELIYILSGVIRYRHGTESFLLQPGDSLSFRGDIPHGPETLETVPIRMLSIIVYDFPDNASGR